MLITLSLLLTLVALVTWDSVLDFDAEVAPLPSGGPPAARVPGIRIHGDEFLGNLA